MNADQKYDARGLLCPFPVLKARKILAGMESGQVLEICADDPMVRIDMPHFCAESGNLILRMDEADDELTFFLRKP